MVNKDRLKLGINALRNGEYKQGKYVLKSENDDNGIFHCCLGVLTEVAIKNGCTVNETIEVERVAGLEKVVTSYDGTTQELPNNVRMWYGLDETNPQLKFNSDYVEATLANDEMQYSFKEIANAFERTFIKGE